MSGMKRGDDRIIGIAVVASLFGIVGAGALHVAYGFGFSASIGLFLLIAAIAGIALLFGWSDSLPPPAGPGTAPTVASKGGAGVTPGTAPTASKPGEETVALHNPTPEAAADHVTIQETVALNTPSPEPVAEVVHETPGTRPEALSGPRDGRPDDLQRIKGVGPALEKLCHSLGFYHFDQIAHWTDEEVAWVDQNLEGFKGRVTRDQWVAQAKELAASTAP